MLHIGVDFGSTYTTVSVYRAESGKLEALTLNEAGTPFIPSVLALTRNRTEIGRSAKLLTGKKGSRVFKAFKMMLPEKDAKRLRKRGFDEEYTPVWAAKEFLEKVLLQVLNDLHETCIDSLVIGVPEIWNNEIQTIDGRTVVRDICQGMDFVKKVQVVSEPAAASAFFAYNYQEATGNPFTGTILLIDYGGGTLDITLNDVQSAPRADRQDAVEIRVLYRTGAGENEEGRIGKAGIIYMEGVMEEAILRSGVLEGEAVPYDNKFYKAVDHLEMELQERTGIIKYVFDVYGMDPEQLAELDEEEQVFTEIEYKGEEIPVTYALLLEVYNSRIRDVLEHKLDEILAFMTDKEIDYSGQGEDNFKIALVGGFGNFYLVKKQVADKFQFYSSDRRTEHIIQNRADCEKAISLGAALLAADVIGMRSTAPYSIGICVQEKDQVSLSYGLYYQQDIEFDKTYFQRNSIDGEYIYVLSLNGKIDKFIVNQRSDNRAAMIVYPRKEFQEKLDHAIQNKYGTAVVGFSVDSSGVLSLHIHDYDVLEDRICEEGQIIELTSFRELFDMQKMEKAVK